MSESQIQKACCGYSKSEGGLNLQEIHSLLQKHHKKDLSHLDRSESLKILCKDYDHECHEGFAEKTYRDAAAIIKAINKDAKYKDMRPHLDKVVYAWVNATCCQLCGAMLEIEYTKPSGKRVTGSRKDTIDHVHKFQDTGRNSYRGRLCMKCNLAEGHALSDSGGDFEKHVRLLSKRLNVDPRVVYQYLYDEYNVCPMELD